MGDWDGRWWDATDTAAAIRSGRVSAAEVLEAAIEVIEAVNPSLNAVIHPMFDSARRQVAGGVGDGPFAGVPMLVKDLVAEVEGEPFWEGMAFLRDRGHRAPADQALVRAFRAAGFVLVGKTNTSELGCIPTTEPLALGPTHNPWMPGRSPGGSSGGSAAAVAAGLAPVAHANDVGGSIRVPASRCGLVGLKPSRGRISQGPLYGDLYAGLFQEFVVTRSVRDAAAVLDAVGGRTPGDPYPWAAPDRPFAGQIADPPGPLRVKVWAGVPGGFGTLTADVARVVHDAGALLAELGHRVDEGHPALLDGRAPMGALSRVVFAGTEWAVRRWERLTGVPCPDDQLEPITADYVARARRLSAADLLDLEESVQLQSRDVARWFEAEADVLVMATCAEPAPPLGEWQATTADEVPAALANMLPTVALASWCNATGVPALSVPLGTSPEGLPIGVHLVAAHGGEGLLLRLAAQLELARPWADRIPDLAASHP
jgi:amidase